MKRKSLLTALIATVIMTSGWSLPSNAYRNVKATGQEVKESVSLTLTSADVVIEYGSEFDPNTMVVAGTFDKVELPIINTKKLGKQEVAFKATKGLETVKVIRTVTVKDTIKPEWTDSTDSVTLEYKEEKDLVELFSATDNVDGELTVTIEGSYDNEAAGTYNMVALAKDSSDNEIRHEFTVEVKEEVKPEVVEVSNGGSDSTTDTTIRSYSSGGNLYGAGWCTWWAQERRIENGAALPNSLGNAYSWYDRAVSYGMSTGHTPATGAVVQFPGVNHVAYVEQVYADGSILISEMGWNYSAWQYNERVIGASQAQSMNYIY